MTFCCFCCCLPFVPWWLFFERGKSERVERRVLPCLCCCACPKFFSPLARRQIVAIKWRPYALLTDCRGKSGALPERITFL